MKPEFIYVLCPQCRIPVRSKIGADPSRFSSIRPLLARSDARCPVCHRIIPLANAALFSYTSAALRSAELLRQ